jgi:hypothetical protein
MKNPCFDEATVKPKPWAVLIRESSKFAKWNDSSQVVPPKLRSRNNETVS